MTRRLFITATDTGAGKTYVTSALTRLLRKRGTDCLALKPVASGLDSDGHNDDVDALLTAQQLTDADAISLYRFQLPAAPMVAAQAEQRSIDLDKLAEWCNQMAKPHDLCLIEGVGGLMVPLAKEALVRDWLQLMPDAEVVLIIGARLGCMNHALLTLAELARMQRTPGWIIFNAVTDDEMARQCEEAIRPWLPPSCRCLQLPYGTDPDQALLLLAEAISAA